MVIEEEIDYWGKKYQQHYEDADSFANLPYEQCQQVCGVYFCGTKLVIAYNDLKQVWGLTGGHIEPEESFSEALWREIKEEANMEILSLQPLGWKKVSAADGTFGYQLRYACAVRPDGAFARDPASRIVEIALIALTDYKQYYDWGKITDYLIKRAQVLI